MKLAGYVIITGIVVVGIFLFLIRDLYLPGDDLPTVPPEPACTADAKLCPDGSAVGRVGPDCAFAPCPQEPNMFAQCAAAGNPVMESYPRQCRWPDGTIVTESVR